MFSQAFVNVPPHFQQGAFKPFKLDDLWAEPSLLCCSLPFVEKKGGPITRQVLSQIKELYEVPIRVSEKEGLSAMVDVKVQKLLPGQFPSVPGWHCAGVPHNQYSGQPDFTLVIPQAFHVSIILSNEVHGVSNTEYVQSLIKPKIWDQEHVYQDLHRQVERMKPDTVVAKDGQFTFFNQKTIHRAKPCERRGVRFFMRFSMYQKPPVANQIVNTQQVYVLSEGVK